jgi:hypothetical protein
MMYAINVEDNVVPGSYNENIAFYNYRKDAEIVAESLDKLFPKFTFTIYEVDMLFEPSFKQVVELLKRK